MKEIEQAGIKYSKETMVGLVKRVSGKINWLELGNDKTGLQHIMKNYGKDFADWGLKSDEQVADVILKAISKDKGVSIGDGIKIFNVNIDGSVKQLKVVTESNGLISSAQPVVRGTDNAVKLAEDTIVNIADNILKNPLANIRYTDKVIEQMRLGDYHSFPVSVDGFGGSGKIFQIKGGDGIIRTKVGIQGGTEVTRVYLNILSNQAVSVIIDYLNQINSKEGFIYEYNL